MQLLSTAIYLADLMLCDKAVTLTCIFICRHFSIATIPGTCIHRERVWQSHVLGVPPPHIAHSISLSGKQTLCTAQCSLVSRLLCEEEEREPGTHCSRMRQVPFRYTLKLWSISAYLLKAALHTYTPCETHTSDFEVKNNIALTVTVCIAWFEVIGKLQRERLRQSRAKAFS